MNSDAQRFRSWHDKAFKPPRFDAVVKVGGSVVYRRDAVAHAVRSIEDAGRHARLLLFPGGGAPDGLLEDLFDQNVMSGSTLAATTLLALDQTGHILADQSDRITAVRSLADAGSVLAEGRIPVLLPSLLMTAVDVFRATNRVSSDSMAGWVAHTARVRRLVLVKSRSYGGTVDDLSTDGLVDEVFPDLVSEYGLDWRVVADHEPAEALVEAVRPSDEHWTGHL